VTEICKIEDENQVDSSLNKKFIMLNNEKTREYFKKTNNISKMITNIVKHNINSDDSKKTTTDDAVILKHINLLNNTIYALSLKYKFNGLVDHKQNTIFNIDAMDSGYPLQKEILFLESDKNRSEELSKTLIKKEIIKEGLIHCALHYKSINTDLQYDLCMHDFYNFIKNNELFLSFNGFNITPLKDRDGIKRGIANWSVFDHETNLPSVFIMMFEYSGKEQLEEDSQVFKDMKMAAIENSYSPNKLMMVANRIDYALDNVHPKCLKKITVGPIYNGGITNHSPIIDNLLKGEGEENWILSWKKETILSKSTRTVSTGFFSSKQEEIYHIDGTNYDAMESGATEIENSIILTYDAYQKFDRSEKDLLKQFKKIIVSNSGEVVIL